MNSVTYPSMASYHSHPAYNYITTYTTHSEHTT